MTNFIQLVTEQCCKCGVYFGLERGHHDRLRKEGTKGSFHCPNGHPQHYTESEADQLRRERDRLKQQLAQKDDDINWQRQQRIAAERQVSAAKGQITRLKKRANAGVCPCCNRTFANMARHMKTQHPDHDPNVIDLGVEKARRA